MSEQANPTMQILTLKHGSEEPHVVKFDDLDRKNTWLEHAVILPQFTPTRVMGWMHPRADLRQPFVLHGACIMLGGVAFQPMSADKGRFIPSPQAILPYEFISPVDIQILSTPSIIRLHEQGDDFQTFMVLMIKKMFFPPPMIEQPPTPKLVTG